MDEQLKNLFIQKWETQKEENEKIAGYKEVENIEKLSDTQLIEKLQEYVKFIKEKMDEPVSLYDRQIMLLLTLEIAWRGGEIADKANSLMKLY
jgi:cell division protein FtsX